MNDLREIFAAIRDPSDYDPPSGPIIIGKPADVPGAVAKARRRKRRAPPYPAETIDAFCPVGAEDAA